MRYQWFQDVPRNVTRKEYQQLQFRNFCALGLGLTAAMMAFASISGLTLQTSQKLDQIETLSINAAMSYEGDRFELIKLEGYLVADNPLTMPDDKDQKVIRGKVLLSVRTQANSGETKTQQPRRETLLRWDKTANPVFLSDGKQRIPLVFDLDILPMQKDVGDKVPRTIRDGQSARTSQAVAIEYDETLYPLPLGAWGAVDTVFTDFERQTLIQGQSVVVVASLETTPQGNQLVDPLGNQLQVLIGTSDEIRQQGQHIRVLFIILAIPLGIASFIVGRSAHKLRKNFIERSNI